MYFDPAIEVGVYPGLLLETRTVMCGSSPKVGVNRSAVAARAVARLGRLLVRDFGRRDGTVSRGVVRMCPSRCGSEVGVP